MQTKQFESFQENFNVLAATFLRALLFLMTLISPNGERLHYGNQLELSIIGVNQMDY